MHFVSSLNDILSMSKCVFVPGITFYFTPHICACLVLCLNLSSWSSVNKMFKMLCTWDSQWWHWWHLFTINQGQKMTRFRLTELWGRFDIQHSTQIRDWFDRLYGTLLLASKACSLDHYNLRYPIDSKTHDISRYENSEKKAPMVKLCWWCGRRKKLCGREVL